MKDEHRDWLIVLSLPVLMALIAHFFVWVMARHDCDCTYVQWWGRTFYVIADIARNLW